MDKFFVFLDIDGTLWDWKYIKSLPYKTHGIIKQYNPESIRALNHLLNILSKSYNPELVVTSSLRKNMVELLDDLISQGLDINIRGLEIGSTIFDVVANKSRAQEILVYAKNTLSDNFVIIDDDGFDYADHFPSNRIIKPNIFKGSLSKEMVDEFVTVHFKDKVDELSI